MARAAQGEDFKARAQKVLEKVVCKPLENTARNLLENAARTPLEKVVRELLKTKRGVFASQIR